MGSLNMKIYFNPFPIMEFSLQNSYSLNSPPYNDKIGSFNETELWDSLGPEIYRPDKCNVQGILTLQNINNIIYWPLQKASKIKGQEARILTSKGAVNIGEVGASLEINLSVMEDAI